MKPESTNKVQIESKPTVTNSLPPPPSTGHPSTNGHQSTMHHVGRSRFHKAHVPGLKTLCNTASDAECFELVKNLIDFARALKGSSKPGGPLSVSYCLSRAAPFPLPIHIKDCVAPRVMIQRSMLSYYFFGLKQCITYPDARGTANEMSCNHVSINCNEFRRVVPCCTKRLAGVPQ